MSINTKTNDILSQLNRLHEAKNNGVLISSEFSVLLKNVEELHANAVKKGIVSKSDFGEDVEIYYNGLDKIFPNHTGLDVVASLAKEDKEVLISNPMESIGRSFGAR